MALVLLHGGVGSRTHWFRNIDRLAKHFHVVAIDLPGFGASPDVPKNIEPAEYVDWVIEAVAEVAHGEKFALAGFSFGGALAAQAAARIGSRVARLSLLAPGGFGVPHGRTIPSVKVPPNTAPVEERRTAVAANLGNWMLSTPPKADSEAVSLQIANIDQARFDSRRVSLRETLIDDLRRISAPLQLIWGELDILAYPSIRERAERCCAVRPDLILEIVPGAGHWVQYEQPEEFNRRFLRFMLGQEGELHSGN